MFPLIICYHITIGTTYYVHHLFLVELLIVYLTYEFSLDPCVFVMCANLLLLFSQHFCFLTVILIAVYGCQALYQLDILVCSDYSF